MVNVYLVIQHQSGDPDYDKSVVYTCATEEVAEYAAKKLNKEYAENVELDEYGLFVDVKDWNLDYHYYDVEYFTIKQTTNDIERNI